jgi:hypothetical protein
MLPWKQNRLLLSRLLLVTEHRITVTSVGPVKPVLAKSEFYLWMPSTCGIIFLMIPRVQFYLRMVSLSLGNLIKIVQAFSEKKKPAIFCGERI